MGCILKLDEDLDNRVTIGAVLLAAGSGSRMGHRPKSLLELDDVPLIRHQLLALSEAGVDEVVAHLHTVGDIEHQGIGHPFKGAKHEYQAVALTWQLHGGFAAVCGVG